MCFFIAPTLIMPLSVQFKFSLGMRLCDKRFGYLQGFIFMENFWNFKIIPNTETILTLVSGKLILKKTQMIPISGFESFCFVVLVKV